MTKPELIKELEGKTKHSKTELNKMKVAELEKLHAEILASLDSLEDDDLLGDSQESVSLPSGEFDDGSMEVELPTPLPKEDIKLSVPSPSNSVLGKTHVGVHPITGEDVYL